MTIPMVHVYHTSFGDVILPEEPPSFMKENGWPDRRFKAGRIYLEYMTYVCGLAQSAYVRGGRLKKAPPFSAWLKTRTKVEQPA